MIGGSLRERRVLITGHTGFKGGWLALWLQQLGAEVGGLALPPVDPEGFYAACGPWDRIAEWFGDIRERAVVDRTLAEFQPEVVFHLAAQPLVLQGHRNPLDTYETNVFGTLNVLEGVRKAGSVRAVVVVTSDKVYAQGDTRRPFVESDPLGGLDPYSSSKACVELMVSAWRHSRLLDGCALMTVRAGNVIGGGDWGADRLIPDIFRAVARNEPLSVRNPDATRPWQHVLEPLAGYLQAAERLIEDPDSLPQALNLGPGADSCWPVQRVVDEVQRMLGAGTWIAQPVPGHEAPWLELDASLATELLGWRPRLALEEALAWTVEWRRAQMSGDDLRARSVAQIEEYEA